MSVDASRETLLSGARAVLLGRPAPRPSFDFTIGFAAYEKLLSGSWEHTTTNVGELLRLARQHGRVILHAEAGAGKTTLAMRAFGRSVEQGQPAVLIDLRRWTPLLDQRFVELFGEDVRRAALLFEHLAEPRIDEEALRHIARDGGALLVVDGLNEVPAGQSNALLAILDAFAARHPQAGVLDTDRLTRRQLPSDAWATAGIAGVTVPSNMGLGGTGLLPPNALLLDLALKRPVEPRTSAAALKAHLENEGGLSEGEFARLARSAYKLYESRSGRTFSMDDLRDAVGGEVSDRLVDAQIVRLEGPLAFFRHHLFHDVLAAHFVASAPDLWTQDHVLDALTFSASAFDAVALVLEQLSDREAADRFLMDVYDWNLYGAAYALARGRRFNSIAVSRDTELAIVAMLADRRWDPIASTVERVEDALRLFPTGLATEMLQADDRDAVAELIATETMTEERVVRWRRIFLGRCAWEQLLRVVADPDPLLGWTAANVLRRESLTDDLDTELRRLLDDPTHVVRWRAAHVLGARPGERNVRALLRRLDKDEHKWVRYGSVRALVELAAAEEGLRLFILEGLRERVGSLRGDFEVLRELERALVLRLPPPGWVEAVAPLIEELWASSGSLIDQDHWRRVGWRVSRAAQPT